MMLVRTERGRNHLATRTGHGYLALCGRTLTDVAVVHRRRDVAKVWRLELRCLACEKQAR